MMNNDNDLSVPSKNVHFLSKNAFIVKDSLNIAIHCLNARNAEKVFGRSTIKTTCAGIWRSDVTRTEKKIQERRKHVNW